MKALIVLGVILLVLALLSLVRVGGAVDYSARGLFVRVLAGPLRITVFPLPERKRKRKHKEKKTRQPKEEEQPESGGSLELVKAFLPLVADAADQLRRKLRVDRLDMDLTVAASNPAMAAMAFGGANMALGTLVPLLENTFQIKERTIRTAVDFDAIAPSVVIHAALTLTIGQGVAFAFHFGLRALKIFLRRNKKAEEQSLEITIARQEK